MDIPPPIPPRPPGFQKSPQPQQTMPYFPPPPQAEYKASSSSSYRPQSQQHSHPLPQADYKPSSSYKSQSNPYSPPTPRPEHVPASPYKPQAHQYTPSPQHQYATAGLGPPPEEPAPAPSRWTEHMFYSNGRPTPAFQALAAAFFQKLDPQGTGYITPEAFSSFQDACLYRKDQNVWKRSLTPHVMFAAEDMADFELKASLEGFYFDHKVVVRNPRARQLPYGGMPLISLAGFSDWTGIDFAADPDEHLAGLNNALKVYDIFSERGPLPRYVFPATRPAELQRRIDEATLRCRNNATQTLNANATRLAIQQRGQQNALDLLSDYRYVYY